MDWTMPPIRKTMPTFTTPTASHEPCSGRQPRRIKVGGGWKATNMANNETRNMSQNMASAIYNDLNLPYHVYMQSGNGMGFRYLADGRRIETSSSTVGTPLILPPPPPPGSPAPPPVEYLFTDTEMSFGPLTWRNGILTRYDFPGGFFSLYDDENELPQLHPYAYITDHLGSVRLTVDGNGSNSGTENARQGMEYLPSGAVFRSTNYDFQTRRFCGKELLTMHGWNMYDSQARFQYSLLPRFSTMDPLAEKYYSFSPYNYAGNDPMNAADPDGKEIRIQWTLEENGETQNRYFIYQGGQLYFENGRPYNGNIDFARAVQKDLNMIREASPILADMLETLENSTNIHIIKKVTQRDNENGNRPESQENDKKGIPSGTTTYYDPYNYKSNSGEIRHPSIALTHELLGHAYDSDQGQTNYRRTSNNIPMYEVNAVKVENIYRKAYGIEKRKKYDGKNIPCYLLSD